MRAWLPLVLALGMSLMEAPARAEEATAAAEPTRYLALRAALSLRDWPLHRTASCRGVAPIEPARSVGDYLAGWLAHQHEGRNQVQAHCTPRGPKQRARCELWLKHQDEEDEWAWGLAFELDGHDRPLPKTLICLGGG
jgi:hypothetical protein